MDIYFWALLPDGVTFLSLQEGVGGTIVFHFGTAPVPFRGGRTPQDLAVPVSYTFWGSEPVGTYFTYAGLAVAGSDPSQPANQLSLAIQAFQFTP